MFGAEPSFDARLGGYTPEAARRYLAWLEAEGLTAQYSGWLQRIDMVFPLAIGGMTASSIRLGWSRLAPTVASLGLLTALAYIGFDYAENAAIGALLDAGVGADDEMISRASLLTQLKYIALGAAALLALFGFAVRRLVRPRDI